MLVLPKTDVSFAIARYWRNLRQFETLWIEKKQTNLWVERFLCVCVFVVSNVIQQKDVIEF